MNWWHYLLLVNLYLVLFYSFYALLLRNETFFQLNRVYLVVAALLSFIVPGIQADWVKQLFITEQVHYTIYSSPVINLPFTPVAATSLTLGQLLLYFYVAGISFLTARLLIQLSGLKKALSNPTPSAAFSFFQKIALGDNLAADNAILKHEQVHARQWHSVDVLLMEAIMIINWFNPVVYLYRSAIKHIHEFIADQHALKVGNDKAEYALLLLSQTFQTPTHRLVNPFYNHSLLKQRIIMIQKNRSQRVKLLKYGLSAPLFILMLILSSATVNNSDAITAINAKAGDLLVKPAETVITGIENNGEIPALRKANDIDTVKKAKVYDAVEKQPEFPGGINAFYTYLAQNIKYPAEARKNYIQGKVYVKFIVELNGSLTDVKAIRGPGHGTNEEAVRVIKRSPKWMAARQNGKNVRCYFTVPINFTLGDGVPPTVKNVVLQPSPIKTDEKPADTHINAVFDAVEKPASFPEGMPAFYTFLAKTVKYPADARRDNITGKVYVRFIVEKDGSLTDIKSVRGPGHGLDEEAVRAINLSPKWKPGLQNGKPVRSYFTVPINFTLGDAQPAGSKPTNGAIAVPNQNNPQEGASKTWYTALNSKENAPLIIVDGKALADMNTPVPASDNIKSMTVLRNASAIALYGDKAKNGVIVVTTKEQSETAKQN